MQLPFIPYPRRITRLSAEAKVSSMTLVVLQMPEQDARLLRVAQVLFGNVESCIGSFALYSKDSFAPEYPISAGEGYLLSVRGEAVQLVAQDAAGIFYGLQTLRQWMEWPERYAIEILDWPELAMRSDYLDMRGLFPKFDNLLIYIEEMAEYKLNTLVIEYEDKLPRSRVEFCADNDTLTREQHARLMQAAQDNFIDVIPLQQSFGHLEYALKLPEYRHLRETEGTPGEMCPLREGSFELAAMLLEETAAMHPNSRYLHLGCDEVWSLGQSEECKASGKSRGQIAVEFINRLAEKTISLGKIPVVWHDMVASVWDGEGMGASRELDALAGLNKSVVVAIWLYGPELVNTVAPELIERLNALGIKALPCSAVRASDRCATQNYPQVEQRLRNVDAWCELIAKTRSNGMINTNWCSTFALGNPYGLFETSRYTAFYAAERCWNLGTDNTDFLERFMGVYHGVYDAEISSGSERRYDYYIVVGRYLSRVTRNAQTARLIEIMIRLQHAVPVNCTAFRGDFFAGSEVELACLKERAPKNYAVLRKAEADLKELLPQLLSQPMAALFYESRVFANRLFQGELERILGEALP